VLLGATLGSGLNLWAVNNSGVVTIEAVNNTPALIPLDVDASTLDLIATSLQINGTPGASCPAGSVVLSTVVFTDGILTAC
jgi:hypothetical protein